MTTLAIPPSQFNLSTSSPGVGVDISVQASVISFLVNAPDIFQSCFVSNPETTDPETPPEPEVPQTGGIVVPVDPNVTYETLPPTPTIVDTSPNQMIGCIIDTGDNPQERLNILFPSAINKDGVIERSTNDIWVFDGTIWDNVGPNPGPTIVIENEIEPWEETQENEFSLIVGVQVERFAWLAETFDSSLQAFQVKLQVSVAEAVGKRSLAFGYKAPSIAGVPGQIATPSVAYTIAALAPTVTV